MRRGKLSEFGSHRGGAFILQSLPPELDALHWPQVRAGPVEPLVVAVAPLPVVNQDFLIVVVNLFNAGGIPASDRKHHEMGLKSKLRVTSRCQVPDWTGQGCGQNSANHRLNKAWSNPLLGSYTTSKVGTFHSCNVSGSVSSCVMEPPPVKISEKLSKPVLLSEC